MNPFRCFRYLRETYAYFKQRICGDPLLYELLTEEEEERFVMR
jgi:hypothetical protein